MTDQPFGQLNMQGIDPLQGNSFFVCKRDGHREEFNEARIFLAIESAFRATLGIEPNEPLRDVLQVEIKRITDPIVQRLLGRAVKGELLEVEAIQDAVEEQLMRAGHLSVARRYILYRDERRRVRLARDKAVGAGESSAPGKTSGATRTQLDIPSPLGQYAALACHGVERGWSIDHLIHECLQQEHQGASTDEWENALGQAAKSQMAREPSYERVAARLLLRRIYRQALPQLAQGAEIAGVQRRQFRGCITKAVESKQLAPVMLNFDLELLAAGLCIEQDERFGYQGLQTLYDEYLLRERGDCVETPQFFWMRLAMGMALSEGEPCEVRVLEFYEALSSFRFIPSASILLNAGTLHPHLADCYSAGGWSDLEHITAQPGGRQSERPRRGLTCSWLEPWHINIADFLAYPHRGEDPWQQDLSKGVWIPDLFMKRVRENGHWTLFNPGDVRDLHQLYGGVFERRYLEYEELAERGKLPNFSRVPARAVWTEIMASISDTGQPWLGFKDAANVRSTQDIAGVVQSGNLCGDILLPTAPHRGVACSVGAINLAAHLTAGAVDEALLQRTVQTAMRMLDNALDIGVYPDRAAQMTAVEQRPIALGIAGFQDMLYQLKISYASPAAVELADRSTESISNFAVLASASLARERGSYPGFEKSKWNLGLLPFDTLALMEQERAKAGEIDRSSRHDWAIVRQAVRSHGMRNCATTAITPVREGAAIVGVTPSGEPALWLGVGELAFGQATQWNPFLVADLKGLNLWTNEVVGHLRDSQGSIQHSAAIPASLKEIYRTAFEIAPRWLIECAARRQKWLDMSQALTLYAQATDLGQMSEICMLAWEKGLKTARQLPAPQSVLDKNAATGKPPQETQPRLEANKVSEVGTPAVVPVSAT
jgi:ribonucleoside-diphosphate reductase alpha chain